MVPVSMAGRGLSQTRELRGLHSLRGGGLLLLGVGLLIQACSGTRSVGVEGRAPQTAGSGGGAEPSCVDCHERTAGDVLVARHVEARVGCTGCHPVSAGHPQGTGGPDLAVGIVPLSDRVLDRIDESCRDCHTRSTQDDRIALRFLHWKRLRERGVASSDRVGRCSRCHRHGLAEAPAALPPDS